MHNYNKKPLSSFLIGSRPLSIRIQAHKADMSVMRHKHLFTCLPKWVSCKKQITDMYIVLKYSFPLSWQQMMPTHYARCSNCGLEPFMTSSVINKSTDYRKLYTICLLTHNLAHLILMRVNIHPNRCLLHVCNCNNFHSPPLTLSLP